MAMPWARTVVLSEDNFKNKTYIATDGYHKYSIDLSNRTTGTLPEADKCSFFCLRIPIGMVCTYELIPETKNSMAKLVFTENLDTSSC